MNKEKDNRVGPSEMLDAGDALADALEACQIRMGCHNCDGDGFCEQCDKVYNDAEKALYAWNAMREASNTKFRSDV